MLPFHESAISHFEQVYPFVIKNLAGIVCSKSVSGQQSLAPFFDQNCFPKCETEFLVFIWVGNFSNPHDISIIALGPVSHVLSPTNLLMERKKVWRTTRSIHNLPTPISSYLESMA